MMASVATSQNWKKKKKKKPMGPVDPQFRCLKFRKSQNITLFLKRLIVKYKLAI
jgi:hypothetical protein